MCGSLIQELDRAEELMDWVDRKQWGENPFEWLFRGQRSDAWCILPSAWRDGRYLLHGEWRQSPATTRDQCQSEYEMVRRFFRLADVQGLPLPGDSPDLRLRLERARSFDEFEIEEAWPPHELHWLIALSQHYGVPTRFVDWTRKPLIACWFAAEEAARRWGEAHDAGKAPDEGRLVVWAIRRTSDAISELGWKFAGAPRAEIPNLHLQSGMFTYLQVPREEFDADQRTAPLCEEVLSKLSETDSVVRAASIPWREAGRMLTLLRDNFVQGTIVYAGFDGVARSVKEHRWRR